MFRRIFMLLSITLLASQFVLAQGTSASTTTADAPKKSPVFRATKDQIKQVQAMLKEKKLYDGEASGTLDAATRTGIKSFQKDNGLRSTGTLNRATLEKFGVELTDKQKETPVSASSYATSDTDAAGKKSGDKPKKAPPFRATADQIKAAQKLLKDGKMYDGEETGKLDDPTRGGLKKYQEANGLRVTGSLNAVTLEKMGIELTDKQKAAAATAAPKN